jgi:CarD family transcriptional regulator
VDVNFRVGDKAVYPAHGVAEVTGIEAKEIGGKKHTFYILRILENGMRIMVPTKNVAAVGLRQICNKNDVKEVYDTASARCSTPPARS